MRGPSVTGFSFDQVNVADYDRLRASYAPAAVAWLAGQAGLSPGDRVADVAAGTGKLTRVLAEAGLGVVAVEPSAPMASHLASSTGGVAVVRAVAESLPFAEGAFACVTVAQAFHHLDAARALAEARRVLPPSGHLALVWNVYADDPLKRALDQIIDRWIDPAWPTAVEGMWRDALGRSEAFTAGPTASFDHPHRLASSELVPLELTSSDIASLPEDRRAAFVGEVEALASTLPDRVEMPASTRVELFLRR
jgi:SAM-dependent methyltransferase